MMSIYNHLVEQFGMTMTPNDVASVLGCHPSHVRAMCQAGELPAVRIGERWFIPTARFAAILEGSSEQDSVC